MSLAFSLYYRIVPVGEASVIVGVSATHRHDALLAVGYAIDEVKACATIWKKVISLNIIMV